MGHSLRLVRRCILAPKIDHEIAILQLYVTRCASQSQTLDCHTYVHPMCILCAPTRSGCSHVFKGNATRAVPCIHANRKTMRLLVNCTRSHTPAHACHLKGMTRKAQKHGCRCNTILAPVHASTRVWHGIHQPVAGGGPGWPRNACNDTNRESVPCHCVEHPLSQPRVLVREVSSDILRSQLMILPVRWKRKQSASCIEGEAHNTRNSKTSPRRKAPTASKPRDCASRRVQGYKQTHSKAQTQLITVPTDPPGTALIFPAVRGYTPPMHPNPPGRAPVPDHADPAVRDNLERLEAVLLDDLGVPVGAHLGDALQGGKVHVVQAKLLREAVAPLKVVQEGPHKVAPHVHIILQDGLVDLCG